jgi:predicted AlkP superfamily pyrophosphatase or phosphodiesterase
MRKLLLSLAFALVLIPALRAQDEGDQGQKRSSNEHGRVLLVSIDAFRPESYREERFKTPNLRALAARGVQAKKCVGVFPTLTYPSHTSIVTGVRTGRHGVASNTIFDPKDGGKRWYYEQAHITATTLWDAAHREGIKTSAIHWPVTIGATGIDYHLCEIFGREFGEAHEAMRSHSTPGLYDEVWSEEGRGEPATDVSSANAAVKIIEKYKPGFLCIHFLQTDGAQHHAGREDQSVYDAFANVDAHVGQLMKALEVAGLASSTNVIVTGDHGMIDVHTAVKPNAILRDLGFLKVDEKGHFTEWQAAANTGGAAAAIYVRDPADKATSERIVSALKGLVASKYKGIFQVLDRDALDKEEAFPGAICALEGEPGYTMEASGQGDVLGPAHLKGNHGYLPSRDEVATGFIAAGPGLVSGRTINTFRMIDIAPLAAHLMNVDLGPGVEGVVIPGILAQHRRMREDAH